MAKQVIVFDPPELMQSALTKVNENFSEVYSVTDLVTSGTYTPTLTSVANVSASTAVTCQYMRVGNVVTVSGRLSITATVNATLTRVGFSLPVASNFSAGYQCGGTGHHVDSTAGGIAFRADATNDRADIVFLSSDTLDNSYYFTFTYLII